MGTARKLAMTLALVGMPAVAPGQAGGCGNRGIVVPDLGFQDVRCTHCMIEFSPSHSRYRFSTEPRLFGIRGPGAGRLRDGDVLAAIDGRLITTDEAGDRMATVRRGERVRLTVRRAGRTQDVDVTAGQRCIEPPVPPTPPTPPRPPAPPSPGHAGHPPMPPLPPEPAHAPQAPLAPIPPIPPMPPVPPAPPEILPEGWFGFGIRCEDCGIRRHGSDVTMFFNEAPVVESVEPSSPAATAGIRRGDVLTHVDGVALTTPAGARRFAGIRPGQRVTWTYRRGSRTASVAAMAARRPDRAAPRAPSAWSQQLRYSGAVGATDVEVRGAPVTITRDERTGETVIRSHDLTVRLRPDHP